MNLFKRLKKNPERGPERGPVQPFETFPYTFERGLRGDINNAISSLFVVRLPGETFVCKRVRKEKLREEEYTVPVSIESPRMIRIVGVYESDRYVYIVMPVMGESDLFDWIERDNIEEDLARECAREVLLAVGTLHEHGYVHLDIKPENFVVVSRDPVKLCMIDFASAHPFPKRKTDLKPIKKAYFTKNYRAPEVVTRKYAQTSDIWSAGQTIYVLCKGTPLPRCIDWGKVDLSCDLVDLLQNMMHPDHAQRFSVDQALAHPWFKGSL